MKRVLAFIGDLYEDLEFWYPKIRLVEAGHRVITAGLEAGKTYTGKKGMACRAELAVAQVDPTGFDGLLVPGGYMPDRLRREETVLEIVRRMDAAGKPIAFICHGGWILISAGILRGRRATSTRAIRDDMVNAGCRWVDEPLVIEGHLISSRNPGDLHHFARAFVERLEHT